MTYKISGYTGAAPTLDLYTTINSDRVTTIGEGTFANNSTLTSITGNSILDIQSSAFSGCTNLQYVNFPNFSGSVTSDMFSSCSSLATVSLPNAATIEYGAFSYFSNLSSVDIHNVSSIGGDAFWMASSLKSINASNCTYIGTDAFGGTSIESVYLPECLSVNVGAFTSCNSLSKVYLPKCSYIGARAFASTNISFSSTDFNSSYYTVIDGALFSGSDKLHTFPRNMSIASFSQCTEIFDRAAAECSSLLSISFPLCSAIGDGAFIRCSNFSSSISFPECEVVRYAAFFNCPTIESIYFPKCSSFSNDVFFNTKFINDQLSSRGYAEYQNSIHKFLLSVSSLSSFSGDHTSVCGAFNYNDTIETITLPNLSMADSQLANRCTNLREINLPSCTKIDCYAIEYCTALLSINLPVCSYLNAAAFGWCTSLSIATLGYSGVCSVLGTWYNVFEGTGITSSTGSIFVPASLVSSYKEDSYWSYYSNVIYPIV